MDSELFWEIIENSIKHSGFNNTPTQLEFIKEDLLKRSEVEIVAFERIKNEKLIELYHYNLIAILKFLDDYVTDDTFLYFRCWIVLQGKYIYNQSLINPDSIAYLIPDLLSDGTGYDAEELLYISNEVYGLKTGKEEDDSFPRDQCHDLDIEYAEEQGDESVLSNLETTLPSFFMRFRKNR